MADIWRIELFGGVRAICGDRIVSRFRSGKSGSLLGYLARYPGRMHSRESLAETFWPGAEPGRGRASLSTAVWAIRQTLEPASAPSDTVLQTSREAVGMVEGSIVSDVAEFSRLMAEFPIARDGKKVAVMERIVELYVGEFMAGYYEDWVFPEQTHFAGQFRTVLTELVAALERDGRIERAIGYAARAVEVEPLREESHRRLIRLNILAGNLEQARRQYVTLLRLLDRELGTRPSASTRELMAGLHGMSKAPAQERGSNAGAVAVAVLRPGTYTVLLADRGDRSGHGKLPDRLRERLFRHVRKYGGVNAGRVTVLAALFPGVKEALECAGAIRKDMAAEDGEDSLSLALDTARVELEEAGGRGPALLGASRLLRVTGNGWTLCSARTVAVASPELDPRIILRDLGAYRLGKTDLPQHVFAVHRQGAKEPTCPPLRTPPERRGAVPTPTTPLFGRSRELAQLRAFLLHGNTRLVTVLGPGGIGKTTLAMQLAADLLGSPHGAVWYVPLGPVSDAGGIADAILRAVHPNATGGSDAFLSLVSILGDQPSILVLDCLEHLLPDATPVLLRLSESCPQLRCLTTSRQAMGLPSEQQFPLGTLACPSSRDGEHEMLGSPAVELFVHHVRTVLPSFEATGANREAVSSLCAKLGGFPLAIVLAAGRASVMTPAQLLKRLEQSPDVLVDPRANSSDRHHSLRAVLAANVALLTPDARALLARLSVFAGSFTLEAAEEVCDAPDAGDLLAELRGCSLLTSEIHGAHLRFHMLDTIREFAGGLATPAEVEAWQRRHIACFRRLAEHEGGRVGGAEGAEALDRLDADSANVNAAIDRGYAMDPEGSLAIAYHLAHYWEVRGLWNHSRHALETALARAPQAEAVLRAKGHCALGWVLHLLGNGDKAWDHMQRSVERLDALGSALPALRARYGLAEVVRSHELLDDAWDLYARAMRDAETMDETVIVAMSLVGMACIRTARADYMAARQLHERALAILRQLGFRRAIAATLAAMGAAEARQSHWDEARALHAQALAAFREVADPVSTAWQLQALAEVEIQCGHGDRALELAKEGVDGLRVAGNPGMLAQALLGAGRVAIATGDLVLGRGYCAEAAALADKAGNQDRADEARRELVAHPLANTP